MAIALIILAVGISTRYWLSLCYSALSQGRYMCDRMINIFIYRHTLYIKRLFHNSNHTLGHPPLWPSEAHLLAVAVVAMAELPLWPTGGLLLVWGAVAELPLWPTGVHLLVVSSAATAGPPETPPTGPTSPAPVQTTPAV